MEIWRQGDMDMETCRHGNKDMDMAIWTWRHVHGDIDINMVKWKIISLLRHLFYAFTMAVSG
jgi:hypothetical protein